jgi:hypothetical protein
VNAKLLRTVLTHVEDYPRLLDLATYTEYTIEHDVAEGDVRRLLKALEAALKSHRPVQLYGLVMCLNGSPGCAHGPDYDGDAHFEDDDGSWRCRDKPTAVICTACLNEDGEGVIFPCGEYEAILAALTGKGAADA